MIFSNAYSINISDTLKELGLTTMSTLYVTSYGYTTASSNIYLLPRYGFTGYVRHSLEQFIHKKEVEAVMKASIELNGEVNAN